MFPYNSSILKHFSLGVECILQNKTVGLLTGMTQYDKASLTLYTDYCIFPIVYCPSDVNGIQRQSDT